MTEYYYYGVAAAIYIALCWMFAVVRWFHTCQQPKEHRAAIWPDRKLQCIIYLMPTFLLPYAINPSDESAWIMYKSYFPATYYFYSATLLLCFFGSLRQWGQWKTASWIGAIITSLTMAPLVANAWMPGGILNEGGMELWSKVVMVVSIVMMVYSLLAMWQVWQWMKQARTHFGVARDRYRCQVPLSPWCMDRYGTKLYKTIIKHRYLIIFALTALCIIGCGNGKRNASESNDEDSTVVNDTLIDDTVEDEGGSDKSLNDIRFENFDENDWLDNEYIRCLRRYLDDYNSGKIENEEFFTLDIIRKTTCVIKQSQIV